MPEWAPDWFSVAIEACSGGTSDLGSSLGILEYFTINRAKRSAGGHRGGQNPSGRGYL